MSQVGLPGETDEVFPAPGSNRGYEPSTYVRTILSHFADGGRYLEDMRRLSIDRGFSALFPLEQIPSPSAIGNWLRRIGGKEASSPAARMLGRSAIRFAAGLGPETDLTIDVDATLIESEKGDSTMTRKGFEGYSGMLGLLSDGSGRAACCYGTLRKGHISPKTGILEALKKSVPAVPEAEDRSIYFRADGAAYQSDILNWCENEDIGYTITGCWTDPVRTLAPGFGEEAWEPLPPKEDGAEPVREITEYPRLVEGADHASRVILWREPTERAQADPQMSCFERGDDYGYGAVVTNIPEEEMSTAEVLRQHQSRGNAERHIGEIKDDLGLAHLPTGDRAANEVYLRIGLLAYNLVGLMAQQVLPAFWKRARIRTLRDRLFRAVGTVVKTARQWWLKLTGAETSRIERILRIETRIEGLPPPGG